MRAHQRAAVVTVLAVIAHTRAPSGLELSSERTGYLARFGQVRWHSPGRESGQLAAIRRR